MKAIADGWADLVSWLIDQTQFSDTILHIHAGMAVLLVARVATGRGLGTFIPLLFVVAAEAANELLNRIAHGSWRWEGTWIDIFNTLLWPVVLSVAVRVRPAVFRRR